MNRPLAVPAARHRWADLSAHVHHSPAMATENVICAAVPATVSAAVLALNVKPGADAATVATAFCADREVPATAVLAPRGLSDAALALGPAPGPSTVNLGVAGGAGRGGGGLRIEDLAAGAVTAAFDVGRGVGRRVALSVGRGVGLGVGRGAALMLAATRWMTPALGVGRGLSMWRLVGRFVGRFVGRRAASSDRATDPSWP